MPATSLVEDIDPEMVSPHRSVTDAQAWRLLHAALDALGYAFPDNRREASALIAELEEAQAG